MESASSHSPASLCGEFLPSSHLLILEKVPLATYLGKKENWSQHHRLSSQDGVGVEVELVVFVGLGACSAWPNENSTTR
jgi:hypothetical protein